jgi:hypothetical protein
VVLPFRNAETTLIEALDSIRGQSLAQFECVLIDHASRDSSAALAGEYAARDRRFRVVRCEGSFVEALNHGVRESRGPLIARMDADDIALPSRLEQQVAAARRAELDLVSCLVECFPRAQLAGGMLRYATWINDIVSSDEIRAAMFVESPLPHPSTMFRRDAFERAGGYIETGGPEDYDLWLRMMLGGARVEKVAEVLLRWRETEGRMSRTDGRYAKARFFETKLRHFPSLVPTSRPLQVWGAGPTARRWTRNLRALGYEICRIVDSIDCQIGRTVQGITVESPAAIRRDDGLVLAAVGMLGAREEIETELRRRGFEPLRDYLAVA